MKNLKKAAALLLVVMLVAMSGLVAYADGEVTDPVAKIGDTEYATLDEAVAAAEDGATVELLKDCTTEGLNLSKNLVIQAAEGVENPTVTFTKYGIALWGKSLTFKDCSVVMNGIGSTPYTAEWNWMTICASKDASLMLDHAIMTLDGTGTAQTGNSTHAIYFCSNNKLNLTDSTLVIRNYSQDALEWNEGDGGYNVNITNSTFISDNNRSGFTGTFYVTIDNSNVDVINSRGNGSNGSHFDIKNESEVNFTNNGAHGLSAGQLTIDNSTVNAIGNGANGIHTTAKMEMKNKAKVFVRENRCTIFSKWTIPGAMYVAGAGSSIDETCTVEITDNRGSGVYVKEGGSLNMKVGTVVRNTADMLKAGGGINNHGTVIFSDAVQLYNNHAADAGDDIYNTGTITFGSVGFDWTLDGVPEHCTDAITGWFDDSIPTEGENQDGTAPVTGGRWNAHDMNALHVEEFIPDGTSVTSEIALKAAHGILYKVEYDLQGGNVDGNTTIDPKDYEEGNSVAVVKNPQRAGYYFNGWTIAVDNQAVVAPKVTEGVFTMPAANVLLTANWIYDPPYIPDPTEPIGPTDPGEVIEPEEPEVPLGPADPEEPVIDVDDPEVPLGDMDAEETNVPKTGDNGAGAAGMLLFLSVAGLAALAVTGRKEEKTEK